MLAADEPVEVGEATLCEAVELGVLYAAAYPLDKAETFWGPELLGEALEGEAEDWLTPNRPFQLKDMVKVERDRRLQCLLGPYIRKGR